MRSEVMLLGALALTLLLALASGIFVQSKRDEWDVHRRYRTGMVAALIGSAAIWIPVLTWLAPPDARLRVAAASLVGTAILIPFVLSAARDMGRRAERRTEAVERDRSGP